MKYFKSISTLLSFSTITITTANTTNHCQSNDPLACSNLGQCRNGSKDYFKKLGVVDVGNLVTNIRDMHCACMDDNPNAERGFSGVHCDTEFERCGDGSVCFNGGYCVKDSSTDNMYHCACPVEKGVAGKYCESSVLDSGMEEEGGFCESYDDPFYQLAKYRWFCVNGGICLENESDLEMKCDCASGYAGLHCEFLASEYEVCSLDCNGVGVCKKGAMDMSNYIENGLDFDLYLGGSNVNGEYCICDEGYTGVNCQLEEEQHKFQQCGPGVCFNGGICVERETFEGEVIDYHCECDEFQTNVAGEFCQHADVTFCPAPLDHDPAAYYCAHGGTCPVEGQEFMPCKDCDEGWTGPQCEIRFEKQQELDCDLKCENGGKCFFGDNPIQGMETIPGLEFLQDNKHCRCPTGYIGLRCEMRYQRCGGGEHYCLHGSDCVDDNDQFTCDCNEISTELVAYAGHYCQHTAAEFCKGPGAGKHSFCTKHGTCRGEIGIGQDHIGCDCEPGWTGNYCEYQIEQLQTNGIATNIFLVFLVALISLVLTVLVFICVRRGKNRLASYEATAVQETHSNPYGDDDEEEDEYVLKEVRIT